MHRIAEFFRTIARPVAAVIQAIAQRHYRDSPISLLAKLFGGKLPHPRAHQRAFVLLPWREVDPAGWLPGRGAIGDLLPAVADQDLRRREDLPLRPPT